MSTLDGSQFLAGRAERSHGAAFTAFAPRQGTSLEPTFQEAEPAQIDRAAQAAAAAFPIWRSTSHTVRADLLVAIADGLRHLGAPLLERVVLETGLPMARAEAECLRTQTQLRQFAEHVRHGRHLDVCIDRGDPARTPQPKPELRSMRVPIGPVAVFGASNFPLAYSVAGGDTASALAVGCPVVVKAHPAHPGTSELVARVVLAAVAKAGLPSGVFSMVHGRTPATGERLVQHPAIAAVGFTGSFRAGRSLSLLAAQRPQPIPVFAEMGSMNPVLVLPRALAARGPAIAESLAASATLASGQFCTSPGLVAYLDGPGAGAFVDALRARITASACGVAVHPSVAESFASAVADVSALPVEVVARASGPSAASCPLPPMVLRTTAAAFLAHARLREEIYGPAVLLVPCRDLAELAQVVAALHGHLTGTVHADGDDWTLASAVIESLAARVGRLIGNGVPTGVEVCTAMVHGGPWPAASDARFTAVGVRAVERWLRPQCWQDWPASSLPLELRDDNPLRLRRRVDGQLE